MVNRILGGWYQTPRLRDGDLKFRSDPHWFSIWSFLLEQTAWEPRFNGSVWAQAGECVTSVREISELTGIPKSTVHRKLQAMVANEQIALSVDGKRHERFLRIRVLKPLPSGSGAAGQHAGQHTGQLENGVNGDQSMLFDNPGGDGGTACGTASGTVGIYNREERGRRSTVERGISSKVAAQLPVPHERVPEAFWRLYRLLHKRKPVVQKELAAFEAIEPTEEAIGLVEWYYRDARGEGVDPVYHRHHLMTILNNWSEEVGKAEAAKRGARGGNDGPDPSSFAFRG